MNIRITAFLAYEGDGEGLKAITERIVRDLLELGYGNVPGEKATGTKSLVVCRENTEILEMGAEEFFIKEIDGAVFTVVPMEEENVGASAGDD